MCIRDRVSSALGRISSNLQVVFKLRCLGRYTTPQRGKDDKKGDAAYANGIKDIFHGHSVQKYQVFREIMAIECLPIAPRNLILLTQAIETVL